MASSEGEITRLLVEWERGDRGALDRLMPLVYAELREIAGKHLRRERRDHTLRPTALVHEAYVKLVDLDRMRWRSRAHFLAMASRAMRRILVDHARKRQAEKRGGDAEQVTLVDGAALLENRPAELLALDEALSRLAEQDARQGRIVELRVFGGLSVEETAEVEGVSPATVKRDWRMARAWLRDALGHGTKPRK